MYKGGAYVCLFLAYTGPPLCSLLYLQTPSMSSFSLEETTLGLYNCMIYGAVGVILSHAYIMILQRTGISHSNNHHVLYRA